MLRIIERSHEPVYSGHVSLRFKVEWPEELPTSMQVSLGAYTAETLVPRLTHWGLAGALVLLSKDAHCYRTRSIKIDHRYFGRESRDIRFLAITLLFTKQDFYERVDQSHRQYHLQPDPLTSEDFCDVAIELLAMISTQEERDLVRARCMACKLNPDQIPPEKWPEVTGYSMAP